MSVAIAELGTLVRFAARIDAAGGPEACHLWLGSRTAGRYGKLYVSGQVIYAHRLALSLHLGRPLRSHEFALHRCDNPPCVNPLHLYVGDQAQNMRDCAERGRANQAGLALGRRPGTTLGHYRTGTELCGSTRGYSRHLRHGEPTCQPCRDAVAAYQRDRSRA